MIKFKIWFKDIKKFYDYELTIQEIIMGDYPAGWGDKIEQMEFLRYTGLRDKNNQRIYEGDIVKIDGRIFVNQKNSSHSLHKIQWGYEDWGIGFYLIGITSVTEDSEPSVNHFGQRWAKDCEVIGNIYSNPNLLEDK